MEIGNFVSLEGKSSSAEINPKLITQLREEKARELTNYDIIASEGIRTTLADRKEAIPVDSLQKLKNEDPEKREIIDKILEKMVLASKTKQGISDDYIKNFIEKLITCNEKLLKNLVENNIEIIIHDDLCLFGGDSRARYVQGRQVRSENGKLVRDNLGMVVIDNVPNVKRLEFFEKASFKNLISNSDFTNTEQALPHELGHAFDFNMGRKLNLQKRSFVGAMCGENSSRFIDSISCSKEFDEAISKDILRMCEKDEQEGRECGQTFYKLLKDKNFSHYLGVCKNRDILFNDITARQEMFAQAVAYVTSGELVNKNFQESFEELFPNLIAFTREIMEMA